MIATWEVTYACCFPPVSALGIQNSREGEGLPQMAETGGFGLGRPTDGDSRRTCESMRCLWGTGGVAEIPKGSGGALELLVCRLLNIDVLNCSPGGPRGIRASHDMGVSMCSWGYVGFRMAPSW